MLIYIYFAHNKELKRSRRRQRRGRKCECALYTINTPTTNILKKKKAAFFFFFSKLLPIATRTTLVCFFILSLKRDAKVTPKLPLHWVYQVVVKPLLTTNNWKCCFAQQLGSLEFLPIPIPKGVLSSLNGCNASRRYENVFSKFKSTRIIVRTYISMHVHYSTLDGCESNGTNLQSNLE